MTAVTVRLATEADLHGLADVVAEGHAIHAAALPDVFRVTPGAFSSAEFRASMAAILARDDDALFVAECDGQIVGTIRATLRVTPESAFMCAERVACVSNLAVLARHAGAGIGRALIEAATRWARDHDSGAVELDVFEFNRGAIAMYEHLGFTTLRRTMRRPLSS